jgi:Nucleotidyl transferase AbiEii toxin, Type IV TA system
MLTKDFAELFACFNVRGVRAVVVGGYALAFHAKPRFTKDIDVFVEPTRDNASRLLAALADFGFGGVGLTEEDFSAPGAIIQLGRPPNRVDLLTAIDGVSFADAWAGRVAGSYGEQPVFYLGLEELRRNKRASGRPQDLADLETLG